MGQKLFTWRSATSFKINKRGSPGIRDQAVFEACRVPLFVSGGKNARTRVSRKVWAATALRRICSECSFPTWYKAVDSRCRGGDYWVWVHWWSKGLVRRGCWVGVCNVKIGCLYYVVVRITLGEQLPLRLCGVASKRARFELWLSFTADTSSILAHQYQLEF